MDGGIASSESRNGEARNVSAHQTLREKDDFSSFYKTSQADEKSFLQNSNQDEVVAAEKRPQKKAS